MPRKKSDDLEQQVALIQQDFDYMKSGIDEIKESIKDFRHDMSNTFVTKDQFEPFRKDVEDLKQIPVWIGRTVFGAALTAIIAGFFAIVGIKKG
jgi:hypothetical protein